MFSLNVYSPSAPQALTKSTFGRWRILLAALLGLLLLNTQPVKATLMTVSPESAIVLAGTSIFPVENLINGSGLSGADPQVHSGTSGNWATNAPDTDYFATAAPIPVLWFDLGSDIDLVGFALWAYTFPTGSPQSFFQANSLKDFSLAFASSADGASGFLNSILFNPTYFAAQPTTANSENLIIVPRQDFLFGETIRARYIMMTITDNYFGFAGSLGGDRVGLGEVAALVSVPEPTVIWLLGLGLLAMGIRRRSQAQLKL